MTNFEIQDGTAIITAETTVIPKRAFYNCSELKRVEIPVLLVYVSVTLILGIFNP